MSGLPHSTPSKSESSQAWPQVPVEGDVTSMRPWVGAVFSERVTGKHEQGGTNPVDFSGF